MGVHHLTFYLFANRQSAQNLTDSQKKVERTPVNTTKARSDQLEPNLLMVKFEVCCLCLIYNIE